MWPHRFPGASGPGRPRDRHTRAYGSEWSISKPARALRTLRRPPHRWGRGGLQSGGTWCAPLMFRAPPGPAAREIATREPTARSGRSRSPPVPSGPSGALHTGGVAAASNRAVLGVHVLGPALPPPTGTAARTTHNSLTTNGPKYPDPSSGYGRCVIVSQQCRMQFPHHSFKL